MRERVEDIPLLIEHFIGQLARLKRSANSLTNEQAEEKERILQALRQAAGNRTKAASALGTSRVTLLKKISRYGIQV